MEVVSTVGVLLKVVLGSYSLVLTAPKAMNILETTILLDVDPVNGAYEMAKLCGFTGLLALLGCLGLGLVFLSISCGIMFGAGAMMVGRRSGLGASSMGITGLAIILGSEIGGAILGSILLTVMNMGPGGLCVMGVILSLLVYPLRRHITRSTVISETGLLLTLLFVVFVTMAIGVVLGITMAGADVADPGKVVFPTFLGGAIILLPLRGYMSFLTEMVLGKPTTVSLWIAFGWLVSLAGVLFGWGAFASHTGYPSYHEVATALRNLMYTLALLAGMAGSVLGPISVRSLEADSVEGLSLWTSLMMAALLNIIEGEMTETGINRGIFSDRYLGAGGALGLQLGTAGMAGVSLGFTGVSIRKRFPPFWGFPLAILGAVCGTILGAPAVTFGNITTTLVAALIPVKVMDSLLNAEARNRGRDRHEIIPAFEAAQSPAALGMVMVGAMVLGAAGLFTAVLGSVGFCGTIIASLNMINEARKLYNAGPKE